MKRAAIYVRVSSEKQADGEKASPTAQEQDARAHCAARGYTVAAVYRDTERYRAGGRTVEPSGTRADRPAWKRMLKDADAGAFDVLIAWREDRLYRGVNRAMLDISERVRDKLIAVELVKEHYDLSTAPVKAWAAGLELEAKHHRLMMGVTGRLRQGKAWNTGIAFGYRLEAGQWLIEPAEAKWVRKIFAWYAKGVSVREIRQRLVEAAVPQKTRRAGAKGYAWEHCVIYAILRHEFYATGIKTLKWDGEVHELPVPPIISPAVWQESVERRAGQRNHPANNLKENYLGLGVTYCAACEWKMSAVSRKRYDKWGKANGGRYNTYHCRLHQRGYANVAGCCKSIGRDKLDRLLWEKVWTLISDDARFNALVEKRLEELRGQEADADAEVSRLERALDEAALERQKVITWGRKGTITETDMETQLAALSFQEAGLRRELQDKSLLSGGRASRLMELANKVRADLRAGAEWLNGGKPRTEALRLKQFELRRRIVEAIVERVRVRADKTVSVDFVLELPPDANIKDTRARFRTVR